MKNLLLAAMLLVLSISAVGQAKQSTTKYVLVNGKITEVTVNSTNSGPDKVYATYNGITFYIGKKGGVYYYRTSQKTGKQYRCYVQTK